MTTETLHYESARAAQQLFNNDERNLRSLETELGVKAVTRDGWIRLEGDADGVSRAKKVFQFLERGMQEGVVPRAREFAHALQVVKHEGTEALEILFNNRIHTSSKKPPITPKTAGQQRYVAAIREHDVTFEIGRAHV